MTSFVSGRADDFDQALLDAFPMHIAVLDPDGLIVGTNRAWQEFARDGGVSDPAMIGTDYLAAGEDTDATVVAEGIQEILDGDRDLFTYEYPCETPEEMRWFTLRAVPFDREGARFVLVVHSDITERKRQEIQLDMLLSKISGVMAETASGFTDARSRADIFELLPTSVTGSGQYTAAWTMEWDIQNDSLVPVGAAGFIDAQDIEAVSLETDDADLAASVFESSEPTSVPLGESGLGHLPTGGTDSIPSTATLVPIRHRSSTYGILGVVRASDTFYPTVEVPILGVLGRLAGQAITALERWTLLHDTDGVGVQYRGALAGDPLFDIASEAGVHIEVSGSHQTEAGAGLFVRVDPEEAHQFQDLVSAHDSVTVLERFDTDTHCVFKLTLRDSIATFLRDHSVILEGFSVAEGVGELDIVVPSEKQARVLHADLQELFPDLTVTEKTDRELLDQEPGVMVQDVFESLTARQITALSLAYQSGFFETPRATDGDQLAEEMGITRQTFHQHLQAAEGKVFETLFESAPVAGFLPKAD